MKLYLIELVKALFCISINSIANIKLREIYGRSRFYTVLIFFRKRALYKNSTGKYPN